MDSWTEYNLSKEDTDILIQECQQEIEKASREQALLAVRRRIIGKKIEEWKHEIEWLKLLRDGDTIDKLVEKVPEDSVKTVRKRYADLVKRFHEMGVVDNGKKTPPRRVSPTQKVTPPKIDLNKSLTKPLTTTGKNQVVNTPVNKFGQKTIPKK